MYITHNYSPCRVVDPVPESREVKALRVFCAKLNSDLDHVDAIDSLRLSLKQEGLFGYASRVQMIWDQAIKYERRFPTKHEFHRSILEAAIISIPLHVKESRNISAQLEGLSLAEKLDLIGHLSAETYNIPLLLCAIQALGNRDLMVNQIRRVLTILPEEELGSCIANVMYMERAFSNLFLVEVLANTPVENFAILRKLLYSNIGNIPTLVEVIESLPSNALKKELVKKVAIELKEERDVVLFLRHFNALKMSHKQFFLDMVLLRFKANESIIFAALELELDFELAKSVKNLYLDYDRIDCLDLICSFLPKERAGKFVDLLDLDGLEIAQLRKKRWNRSLWGE